MKKLLPALFCLVVMFTACDSARESGTEAAVSTSATSKSMAETAVPYEETEEYSKGAAHSLYSHYLDKALERGSIADYRLAGISLTKKIKATENDFTFLAYYDVLPVGEDFLPGTGEKQADGWVTGKIAEVTAVRDLLSEESMDGFSIESQHAYAGENTSPPEPFKHGIDSDELEAEAKRLYTECPEESISQYHFITMFKIHDVSIEYIGKDFFDFSVTYDTLLANKNTGTANGAIFKDGWVTGRYAYVIVHKIDGKYVINDQGTNVIMRAPEIIGEYLFSIYLEENKAHFSEYKPIHEQVETIGEDFFTYSATFDMLPSGEDFLPGTGEKQADGWVRGKYVYIVLRDKGYGCYEIESVTPQRVIID